MGLLDMFGGGSSGAGGGGIIGDNGGVNMSQIPFIGGMMPNPNEKAMREALQRAQVAYGDHRGQSAQAYQNMLGQVLNSYQPVQNALGAMYGGPKQPGLPAPPPAYTGPGAQAPAAPAAPPASIAPVYGPNDPKDPWGVPNHSAPNGNIDPWGNASSGTNNRIQGTPTGPAPTSPMDPRPSTGTTPGGVPNGGIDPWGKPTTGTNNKTPPRTR